MSSYILQKNISHNTNYDIIVIGGGPAGCAAAAQAARGGAKTLLVEATGCLGGMGTSGMVPAWCPMTDGEKVIYRGIAEEIYNRSTELYPHPVVGKDWTPIDPESLKRAYDELIEASKVDVLFCTMLSDVDASDGKVNAVILSNKSGLVAYSAKTYIDATGDGDLAAWAGAEFMCGDEELGEIQAATHCFALSNVDEQKYLGSPELNVGHNSKSVIYDIMKDENYPLVDSPHACQNLTSKGTVGFNAGHLWGYNSLDPISVSKGMLVGRKKAWQLFEGLVKYAPETYKDAWLSQTAPIMGVRESRRIVGDYVLNIDDYLNRQSFDDEICRCCYYIDMHASSELRKRQSEHIANGAKYEKGESYGVPYRTLTPKGLYNVLVAGRCISCDRPVQASVRIMPAALATGQAAGAAAVLANGADVHSVDTAKLREVLIKANMYIK